MSHEADRFQAGYQTIDSANMTDEECGTLPVFCYDETCVSCWRLSWKERLSALFFGTVWVWVWSGQTQPPIALRAKRTVFSKEREL